ncbi:hypothetical protein M422DRAFT_51423 [Sphaerobolus stellatus SS14]|uniref:Uncharacterized protein n=1 Tax=Sphaerobolus stellatus (strain SS14) TaxID=990650 RepID=A0A0C9ULB0_SPHS4|nr:hypothetical protein M422DRAFT_51423 [Sphaerobolus stellatus SS14]
MTRRGGHVWEAAMDSAWDTNGSGYKLFGLVGEAYGSGSPLGFMMMLCDGGVGGSLEHHLNQSIYYFETEYHLKYVCDLSDENHSELSFWHGVTAVEEQLCIIKRRPAFYNAKLAHAEHDWIDLEFIPIGQIKDKNINIAPPSLKMIPTVTPRVNGEVETINASMRPQLCVYESFAALFHTSRSL